MGAGAAESCEIDVGFCSVCGIIREDAILPDGRRVPVTDCACSAILHHKQRCLYLKLAGSPIDIGGCERHGRFPCEACDCTCDGPDLPEGA